MAEAETMRAWRVHAYGAPREVLRLERAPVPEPGAGELLVCVQAIPLNLNDLERIGGGNMMVRPEFPYAPGMEVLGEVVAAGPGVEDAVGRRVAATTKGAHGGFAEYAVCPAVSAFDVPETIPVPEAAAVCFPFHLAWLGLVDRADLRAGESVLVHAAAGGAGSAAVQLAKQRGARVFATAGGKDKLELCRSLGADVVVDYRDGDFADVVLAETDQRGVDVVFDGVGEAVLEPSLKAIAYNGRYVMMGFASNKAVADEPFLVPRRLMLGNVRLCCVMMAYAPQELVRGMKAGMGWNMIPRDVGLAAHAEILAGIESGALRPVVGRTVGFDELPGAVEDLANRRSVGRTIAVVDS
ncbi:MAG: quinone oxidoreductase family protein [Myxococcota bacterium]